MAPIEIIRCSSPKSATYLTCSDLIVRQYCPGVIVGFSYAIDPDKLTSALQTLVDQHFPILTGRLQQDGEGRLLVDASNDGFPLSICKDKEASLSSILPTLSRPLAQETLPVIEPEGHFLQKLDLVGLLAGKAPLCALRLTEVCDGSVLGLSISHTMADAEGFGQLLFDLSRAYRGLPISPKAPKRIAMQQLALRAAGSVSRQLSDEELVKSLPKYQPPARTYEELVDQKVYDIVGTTSAERKAGVWHSHHLLHLPGKGIDHLRSKLVSSTLAKDKGISHFSVHDIVAALIWVAREAGEGNDLRSGLKRPLSYAVDLRRLPNLEGYEIPEGFWGNAVTANFVEACELPAKTSTSQPGHLLEVLASAACAIRIGTNTVQGDPGFRKTGMSLVRDMAEQHYWKELSEQSGPHPFKDAAALYTGWRSGSVDRADFGHGTPWIVGGVTYPLTQRFATLTMGPGQDGAMSTLDFKNSGYEQLVKSKVLEVLAPEARFI